MFKDAEISIDVSFVRLFDGFGELFMVPLRVFGGVNVKAPSLGVVLQRFGVRGGYNRLFVRRLRWGWRVVCSGL